MENTEDWEETVYEMGVLIIHSRTPIEKCLKDHIKIFFLLLIFVIINFQEPITFILNLSSYLFSFFDA